MSDRDRLLKLLALPREERETPEVVANIRDVVSRDGEARKAYVRWAHFESSIGWAVGGGLVGHQEILDRLKQERQHSQRRIMWTSAACAAIAIVFFGLVTVESIRHSNRFEQIAPVVAWQEVQPDAEGILQDSSSPRLLRHGERLRLRDGAFVIHMTQGATVTGSGLVDIELISPQEVMVFGGNVCAHVPPQAAGFCVVTPAGRIVDKGTRFGVSVDFDRTTEVHVLQGAVDLSDKAGARKRVPAGIARQLNMAGVMGPDRPVDASLFSRQLQLLDGILNVSEDLQFWVVPPEVLGLHTASTGQNAGVFPEVRSYVLKKPLTVYSAQPGQFRTGAPPELIELAEGLAVKSYFFHCDANAPQPVEGEITFDRPILGLLLSSPQLDETDYPLGRDGVRYPAFLPLEERPDSRAFVIPSSGNGSGGDEFTILPDGRTIRMRFTAGGKDVDQFRVLLPAEGSLE